MFKPKRYQEESLDQLRAYLAAARRLGAGKAFDELDRQVPSPWHKRYKALKDPADAPYVCLRLPTGGGKTFLAAQCVKVGAHYLERDQNPVVLWLVPTDTIRRQTLESLLDPNNPNHKTLAADFDDKLRIIDISDFSLLTPQDFRDKACIIVGTFAALRVEKTAGRKVYEHREDFQPHFANIPSDMPGLEMDTEGPNKGKIRFSFANILSLVRPLVIVDEAHNNNTSLSYEVLKRTNAGCVIEFTATPAADSNILHHVSVSQLKLYDMIKLPIVFTEHPTWKEAITNSILTRRRLETLAYNERDFVRPIVLIQAESRDCETTVEVVEKYLAEQSVPRARIAIATGSQRELADINLLDKSCKIEYVITVEALKEGWDCPFAYVFCSVATVHSTRDVEQLLGRVLRMPYARKRDQDELNRAYAYVSKTCWQDPLSQLHDRLVSMGFDDVEAAAYMKPEPPIPFPELPPLKITVAAPPALELLGPELRGKVTVVKEAEGTFHISFAGSFTVDEEKNLVQALPESERGKARQILAEQKDLPAFRAKNAPKREPFRFPQLCLWIDGGWEPVEREHFFSPDSWNLLDYSCELSEEEFKIEEQSESYLIDITGNRLTEKALGRQAPIIFRETPQEWTDLQLVRMLDRSLRRDGIRQEVMIEFIRRVVNFLMTHRQFSLAVLYRYRGQLEYAIRQKIERHAESAREAGYQACLFAPEVKVETSFTYTFDFDPDNYPATSFYHPGYIFEKHFYPGRVAELNGEEAECARAIDLNPHVKRWVRNIPGLCCLPVAHRNFYPDFIAELNDGRMMVVEYKGVIKEPHKQNIGELWERASHGKALFVWAVKKDDKGRDVYHQIQDRITGK